MTGQNLDLDWHALLEAQLQQQTLAFDARMLAMQRIRRCIPPGPIDNEVDAWRCANVPKVFPQDLSIDGVSKCH